MNTHSGTVLDHFDLIIFGGTGDLSLRKLLPAFYQLERLNSLSENSRIVVTGRETHDLASFFNKYEKTIIGYLGNAYEEQTWQRFVKRLSYLQFDTRHAQSALALAQFMQQHSEQVKVFYLAVSSTLFPQICDFLAGHQLNHPNSRIVLEKPLGIDFDSSEKINSHVAKYFNEQQIYRIDHYLGKEAVQNLFALRFGNTLFETLWRRQWVSHVQITVSETVGVERRAEFYDGVGAMRDMVQNHLLQLLSIVAMEPPTSIDSDVVRDEKVKVLHALKPLGGELAMTEVVRGQYRAGSINGHRVLAYTEEQGVPANSMTETFVAMRVFINNWRWAGVPFYLRTGKRLQERVAEIVIHFREVPHLIFPEHFGSNAANLLVIRLQPEESLELHLLAKKPGDTLELRPAMLDLNFAETFQTRSAEAYERLIADVIRGKLTLFVRRDEGQAAWRWIEPILDSWKASGHLPRSYPAGSWGPSNAAGLLTRLSHCWREEL